MAKKRPRRPLPASAADQGEALAAALKLHQHGQFPRAEKAYGKILLLDSKNAVVHHLLGRLYFQTDRRDAAIAALQQAVVLQPEYPDALLDLANMLHEVGSLTQAENCLHQLIRLRPEHALALNNLGVLYKDQQRFDEAIGAYRSSLQLDACNAEVLCNLAHALTCIDDLEGAVQTYRRVLDLEPASVEAHRCLVSLLRRAGQHAEAIEILSSWLELEPDNPVARHLVSAGSRTEVPQRASDEYVRDVFDKFAVTFEADLARLKYRGPLIVEQALTRELGSPEPLPSVLDAGCGTGLCGPVLRPFAQRLVGVDISRKMLEVAGQRRLYDELVEAELGDYLSRQSSLFDLIASADTFGYFGDLAALFLSAHAALVPGGLLLATIELSSDASELGYHLQSSGRYCHDRNYVSGSCEAAGFTIRNLVDDVLRVEAEQDVRVVVLAAQK
ncbi:tetratricopeptide repeat protein [Aureliella helgolandensis]|nr:tetratricopeptide repeat protein [Aureliella helgolandensis]